MRVSRRAVVLRIAVVAGAALLGMYAIAEFREYRRLAAVEAFRSEINSYPEYTLIPERVFERYYESVGPVTMRDELDARPFCHPEAHGLGAVMYKRANDMPTAVLMCGRACSGGCVHGVLLGFVEGEREISGITGDPRAEDISPDMRERIRGLCDESAVTRLTGIGNCYHVLGHAYAYLTDNSVGESLKLCDMLSSHGDGAVFHCSVGVYMQRSLDEGQADARATPTKQYPCDTFDSPAACYRYKLPILFEWRTETEQMSLFCDSLHGADREGCFHGLGIVEYSHAVNDPDAINRICARGTVRDKRMCVEAVIGQMMTYGEGNPEDVCEAYTGMPAEECFKSFRGIFDMQRDYSDYMVRRTD